MNGYVLTTTANTNGWVVYENDISIDYKEFFTNHTTVSDMNKAEYENQILAILEKNTANMSNDELRFYMNEMVIYSLKEAMRDGNNRVKRIR